MTIKRLFEIPYRQLKQFPKQDALAGKENGQWKKYSTGDYIDLGTKLSRGLVAKGFVKGDTIAIISANRPEWNIADLGMSQIGVISVPLYTTLSDSEITFILNDCGAKAIFIGSEPLYQRIKEIQSKVSSLHTLITFDKVGGALHWSEMLSVDSSIDIEKIKDSIDASDVATMLYTSGTTGTPKGVMLTHDNIVSNIIATEDLCPVGPPDRALSFLPLCHSYERMLTYMYQFIGVSIYYAESNEKIADNLKEICPQVFSTVPRLLEKVYDKIVGKGKELKGIKRALFFWALDLGHKYDNFNDGGFFYNQQLKLANKIIFSKWREALGGNVKVIVSGGAALQPRLARVFWSANIHVLEGYGLTETSPVIAVNNLKPNGARFGTVGPVIPGVTVKIAEDGEILCKGPNVMKGYYNRPDLTAEAIDNEGWFHTGDIGEMVDNRFLKITDRKKEIFKTSGGKYIAPQGIENKFKESQFIEQIMVIGENQKFPAALIVPAFAFVQNWCQIHNVPFTSNKEIIKDKRLIDRIQEEVDQYNKEFSQPEQLKKFVLLPAEWTVDTGELTATLKLKRKIIMGNNKAAVESIYQNDSITV